MSERPVTLPMIEACLAANGRQLVFPPAIEALYGRQMESYRRKIMAKGVLPTVVIYNIFLVADYLLLPQTFLLAVILHFAVVTPLILAAAYFYPRARSQWLRDVAVAIIPLMIVAQIMFIYSLNEGAGAHHYQYLAVMIVIYSNVILNLGFRIAVATTLLLVAAYLGVVLSGHSPFEVKFLGTSLMVSAAYLSLMASRRMEQDLRFNFLRRQRDQMRREGAEEVAKRDALTGLANRRALDEVVQALWAADDKPDSLVAVIMADIDYFKPFNDRYGHAAGDVCLKRVAGAMTAELRNERDLAVRFGGEEFLLLLPSTELSEAVRVAERVRRHVEAIAIPHEEFGPRAVVTASLGVAAGPVSAHDFAELLAGADAALYAAKRNGRNQVWPPFISRDNPVSRLPGHAGENDREAHSEPPAPSRLSR